MSMARALVEGSLYSYNNCINTSVAGQLLLSSEHAAGGVGGVTRGCRQGRLGGRHTHKTLCRYPGSADTSRPHRWRCGACAGSSVASVLTCGLQCLRISADSHQPSLTKTIRRGEMQRFARVLECSLLLCVATAAEASFSWSHCGTGPLMFSSIAVSPDPTPAELLPARWEVVYDAGTSQILNISWSLGRPR